MDARPLISLAVIVRDQAELLRQLLAGHRGLYDEAVVVDTGSSDDSATVAAAAGARLVDEPWRDDFARARNAGLARCRGRWILVLDCDEGLEPTDQVGLRALAAEAAPQGVVLPQWNYTEAVGAADWRPADPAYVVEACGARGYVPAYAVRMFPNRPDLRYQGQIHESVEVDLAKAEVPCHQHGFPIHHHGYQLDSAALKKRILRNGRILRAKIKNTPQCPTARREMAEQLVAEGQATLARRLLARSVAEAPQSDETPGARRLLARLLVAEKEFEAASFQVEAALRDRPDWPDCWLDAVRLRLLAGDQRRAARLLAKAKWLFPSDLRFSDLISQVSQDCTDNSGKGIAASG